MLREHEKKHNSYFWNGWLKMGNSLIKLDLNMNYHIYEMCTYSVLTEESKE